MKFMSCLFERFLYREEEIYNHVSKIEMNYNIDKAIRYKEFWIQCIKIISNAMNSTQSNKVDESVYEIVLICSKWYRKKDLQRIVYKVIKCIDIGYRRYALSNIVDRNELLQSIEGLDKFFYNYMDLIEENNHTVLKSKFVIKREEINYIIDSIPMVIILKDKNGKWLAANKMAKKVYELDFDYIGKTDMQIAKESKYIKDLVSYTFNYDDNIWKSKTSYFYPEKLIKGNKEMFFFVTKIPMVFNNGEVLIVVKSDTTKSRLAQKKVNDSEKIYKNILSSIPEPVFVQLGDNVLYLNKKGMELMGITDESCIIGKSYKKLIEISPKSLEFKKHSMKKLICSGENVEMRSSIKRKVDGKVFDMQIVSTLLPYDNEEAILNIIYDPEKKDDFLPNLDEKENIVKSIVHNFRGTQFMGTISHELRTPINIILSALQVMELYRNYGDTEEKCKVYEKYYFMMKQNCYRLLRIVNNFMDVSEIEDGVAKTNLSKENIINIIEDVTLAAAAFVSDKGKNIIFDTDIEEKIMLVDKEKIERMILNLLSNAIKFTDGHGKIIVNVHDEGSSIKVSIKDNGIGIPADKEKIIFEKFGQVDKTFTRKNEGSGIGLSIVKKIVKLHNGEISLKSKVDYGSEFIITLPVVNSVEQNNEYSENVIKLSSEEKVNVEFSDLLL